MFLLLLQSHQQAIQYKKEKKLVIYNAKIISYYTVEIQTLETCVFCLQFCTLVFKILNCVLRYNLCTAQNQLPLEYTYFDCLMIAL